MRQGILAAALWMASAAFAWADYVIIVANVGGSRELIAANGSGMLGMAGMAGMRPGMMGGPPGSPTGMMGSSSIRPSMPMPGGQAQGMPPGMTTQGPPAGMRGSSMPGSMMMGMRGGSMPGSMMMMGMRSMMMGMMGLGSDDVDDFSDYVLAVVEVKPTQRTNLAKVLDQQGIISVKLPERLGKTCRLLKNPSFGELFVITEGKDNKPIPTILDRFKERWEKAQKEKVSVSDLLNLAEWALEHGLVDKFPEVMDKVVETDKGHSAAVAYVKVKADLDRKAKDSSAVASWYSKLLPGYKPAETPHYLLVHNLMGDVAAEIKPHIEHLENALRGFYYWFALRGIALPVPQERQVVVLTSKVDDFEQLHKILTPGPLVVDGFFARRENLVVMYSQRQDDPYKALSGFWENWKAKGYQRSELLQNKNTTGVPKLGVPPNVWQAAAAMNQTGDPTPLINIVEAQMLALMLKALEEEADLATVSHLASRQLLFASELLPRNVAAPEWILSGMGSFFETPLQSPWPTIGAPSPYYLPRWRELKGKEPGQGGLEKTAVETLRKAVTDHYFRILPPQPKAEGDEHLVYEAALRKARTIAWSLTYFLAQKHLDGLRHYFAELSKMPRDIELDEVVLLNCFARAFGCVDGNNNVDAARLKALADEWYGYWQTVHFESEPVMKEIREKIAKKMQEAEEKAKKQNEANNTLQGLGGFPPGMNPGGFPPGMNPPPGGPQQGGPFPPNNPGRTTPQSPTSPKRP